ncbi:hypothetical protein KFE25_004030 [Diacronema lutheri]|uniref:Uncharacterized protein n=1 Tax=Diacronema lutheri TaxID=2081491 RepID=A0A8J5XLD1_DIALT|nr:hypothetical protein KFE25_004030 [Diacronema lutheri]
MAGLPAYVSACAEVVIFQTVGYDDRAWCQAELMMAYAFMTVGDKVFQIAPGFEHRRQATWRDQEALIEAAASMNARSDARARDPGATTPGFTGAGAAMAVALAPEASAVRVEPASRGLSRSETGKGHA